MNHNIMHCLVYRLRKKSQDVKIDVRERIIYFEYNNDHEESFVQCPQMMRLVDEFGFVRQSELR